MTKRSTRRASAAKPAAPSTDKQAPAAAEAPAAPALRQQAIQITKRQWELVQIADQAVQKAVNERAVMFNTICAGAGISDGEVKQAGTAKDGTPFVIVLVPLHPAAAPRKGKPPTKAPRKRGK